MTSGVLLETVHGSHLYGLSHAGSDLDTYRVIDGFRGSVRPNRVRHTVDKKAGTDVTVVGLSTFMRMCEEGLPQALEAMFSPVATVDALHDLRRSYRVGNSMRATYMRTAKNFAFSDEPKKKRHALRLLMNLYTARRSGIFNPQLNYEQKMWLAVALSDFDNAYDQLCREV